MLVALVGKVDLVLKVGVVVTAVLVSKEVGTRVCGIREYGKLGSTGAGGITGGGGSAPGGKNGK